MSKLLKLRAGVLRTVSSLLGFRLSGGRRLGYDFARRSDAFYSMHEGVTDQTASALFGQDGAQMRRVARDLVRNNEAAVAAVDKLARKVVGRRGLWPQVKTGNTRLDGEIEQAWKRASKGLNLRRNLSWGRMQRLFLREIATAGEGLAYHGVDDRGHFFVEPFEPEQLINHSVTVSLADGEQMADGIVYDAYGRPLRYYVSRQQVGMFSTYNPADWNEISADRVFHVYDQSRPSQFRGVTRFASAGRSLFSVKDANTNEATALRAAGQHVYHIKPGSETPGSDILEGDLGAVEAALIDGDDTESPNTRPKYKIDTLPGGVTVGDWDMNFLGANRPGGQYLPFIQSLLMMVAASFGIPYHVISGDVSKANYSSLRAAMLECRETYEDLQELLIEQFCVPMFAAWLQYAVTVGDVRLTRPIGIDEVLDALSWQRPGFPYVDPLKEVQAIREELDLGLKTWSQAVAERGFDPEEQLLLLEEDRRRAEELGIKLPGPGMGSQSGAADVLAAEQQQQDAGTSDMGSTNIQEAV